MTPSILDHIEEQAVQGHARACDTLALCAELRAAALAEKRAAWMCIFAATLDERPSVERCRKSFIMALAWQLDTTKLPNDMVGIWRCADEFCAYVETGCGCPDWLR